METLWVDLTRDEAKLKSPIWHQGVLRDREEAFKAGKLTASDWKQVKERIKKKVWQKVARNTRECEAMKNSWQVATAAEAFAAAQFARCGWDVSVQYGANQPEYDLVAVDGARVLKISVKGSKDTGWGITQSYLKNADYHDAADKWLAKHNIKTVLCLVEFHGTSFDALPRMYLATPREIAQWLKNAARGRGDTILYEKHTWSARAHAAGTTDEIPQSWEFTPKQVEDIAAMMR
jgi:hypothetical protein